MTNMINAKNYVVLDVETNGLSSINDDLLSISIYKPDDEKVYNRFLPLELVDFVFTTWVNGITEEMLKDKLPLTQSEFDDIINEFELDKRTILTYGSLDEKFIKNYLKRKKIYGFERLTFYNFKHDVISSSFTGGNVTKDNLCKIYGIENVQKVHSGVNDCILEWELFKKMNGNKLLVINNYVYELNDEYIIPISYLTTYPNFKYYIENLPKIKYKLEEVKKIKITSPKIKKFARNISGLAIEHLINVLVNVKKPKLDMIMLEIENRRKLKMIGKLPSVIYDMPVSFDKDGTITALNKDDEKTIEEINEVTKVIKAGIQPLVDYIKNDIFNNETIMSQELVINEKDNIMAKCDLSSNSKILEIKSYKPNQKDLEKLKYQLYYQSNGREIYFLQTDWDDESKEAVEFTIYKVFEADDLTHRKEMFENRVFIRQSIRRTTQMVAKYLGLEKDDKLLLASNRYSLKTIKLNKTDKFNRAFLREYFKENEVDIDQLSINIKEYKDTILNWLNGKSTPSVWHIFSLCVWLNIDEKDIIIKK